MSDVDRVMEEIFGESRGKKTEELSDGQAMGQAVILRDALVNRQKLNTFKVGDYVEWKPHCVDKRVPARGQPAIIVEVLDGPIFDTSQDSASSPYFRQPLDIILGTVDDEGDMIIHHHNSRCFQPVKDPEEKYGLPTDI